MANFKSKEEAREYMRLYRKSEKGREYRQRQSEKLKQWYLDLKRGPCADCKQTFHPAIMEWDHRPGEEKTANVSVIWRSKSKSKLLTEITKCDLVCSNCHAMRTYLRREEESCRVLDGE